MPALPTRAAPRVSVVIVAARRADRLERCLAALARALAESAHPAEVVLVLNGADAGVRALAARTTGAVQVDAAVGLGFADGANLGVAAAAGELVLLLHDDAEPRAGWLDPLVAFLDGNPGAGAVASAAYLPDGAPQLAGALLWSDATTSPSWGDGPARMPGGPLAVDYAGSASLLVRRAAWEAAGGADPELHPAYYVDVDLSMRLRRAGYAVFCEPRSAILHHKSSSSSDRARVFASRRNRERVLAVWAELLAGQAPPGDVAAGLAARPPGRPVPPRRRPRPPGRCPPPTGGRPRRSGCSPVRPARSPSGPRSPPRSRRSSPRSRRASRSSTRPRCAAIATPPRRSRRTSGSSRSSARSARASAISSRAA